MGIKVTVNSIAMAIMLVSVTSIPVSAEYREDTWLANVIGPELLEKGDEFGCQAPDDSEYLGNFDFVGACKDYLNGRINSSRWGVDPISFATPKGNISPEFARALHKAGFTIIGDLSQTEDQNFTVINRNGGSIESGLANRSLIESIEEGSLVSLYWVARVDDMNIRRDRQLVSWILEQDYWFTTWGEWVTHQRSSLRITVHANSTHLTFTNPEGGPWRTPGTIFYYSQGKSSSLSWSDEQYNELGIDDRILRAGYRNVTDRGIYITIPQGESVSVERIDGGEINFQPTLFNGLEKGLTIAGHHATNMREWSQDFSDTPLRFTWLVEREEIPAPSLLLPALAMSVLIATPIAIRHIIAKDRTQLKVGPLMETPESLISETIRDIA